MFSLNVPVPPNIIHDIIAYNRGHLVLEGRVRRMDEDGLTGLLEALSARHEARGHSPGAAGTMDELSHFARVNRVERVMQPYLEAVTQ